MYIFGRFDEVSAIRKPKIIITSSIIGSQIFFADFVFFTKTKRNTAYRKTVNNTNIMWIQLYSSIHSISTTSVGDFVLSFFLSLLSHFDRKGQIGQCPLTQRHSTHTPVTCHTYIHICYSEHCLKALF